MDLLIVLVGVLILLFLIGKAKLNTFVSLVIVSFIVAMLLGIDFNFYRNRDWRAARSFRNYLWVWSHAWPLGLRCRRCLSYCAHAD